MGGNDDNINKLFDNLEIVYKIYKKICFHKYENFDIRESFNKLKRIISGKRVSSDSFKKKKISLKFL